VPGRSRIETQGALAAPAGGAGNARPDVVSPRTREATGQKSAGFYGLLGYLVALIIILALVYTFSPFVRPVH